MNYRISRTPARLAALSLAIAASLLLLASGPAFASAKPAKPTIVSLTFDDSNLDQYTNALPILQQYGMHGTFYAITGYIGVNSGAMTLPDLQAIYNDGNEIAGHTVRHPYLTHLSTDEATREICGSRDTLLSWGFPVTRTRTTTRRSKASSSSAATTQDVWMRTLSRRTAA
jgi:peptidoglycan/xylan/chitin deacetylase (PgdA/CDA1 family)